MAKPGTKPQPSHMKLVRGNPGKRPINENEPQPDMDLPTPPEGLSDHALKQWDIVAPQLHKMGVLSKIDATALEMYCVAYGNWREAQEKIRRYGPLVKAKSGFLQQSPYMQIANKSFEQMRSMLAEFGMTPSSRTRISVPTEKKNNVFAQLKK